MGSTGGLNVSAIRFAMIRILPVVVFGLCWATSVHAEDRPDIDLGRATLAVRIENVSAKGGVMRLGLYTQDTYYHSEANPVASFDLPARGPVGTYELAGLPPGTYAVQVFQDLNGNGKMDFNWAGLPVEPYGFSRDARAWLTRPDFARVKITLEAGRNSATIHLQNSDKRPVASAELP